MSKSHWFSKKNPAALPGTFAMKGRLRARRRRARAVGAPWLLHASHHLQQERRNGHKGIQPPHPTGKNQLVSELKRESRKKHWNAGGSSRPVEDSQQARYSQLPLSPSTRAHAPCTPSPTAALRAPLGLGLQSKSSRWAIPKQLCSLQRKPESKAHKLEGRRKKEKHKYV